MPTIENQTANQAARLNFRLPTEIKESVEQAALVSGVTVTDFAITALAGAAEDVLEKHNRRILSDRDRDAFLELLENPPAPNERLKRAVKEYKKRVVR